MTLFGLELLILAAVKAAFVVAVLSVVVITIEVIESFFSNWASNHNIDPDDVGFLVNEAITKGEATAIVGIFNKRTKKVHEGVTRIEGSKGIQGDLTRNKVTIFP